MMQFLYKPAFYAHLISGICIFTAAMIFLINYKKVIRLEAIQLIQIFSFLGLAMASYGEGHILLEKHYNYDPVSYFM